MRAPRDSPDSQARHREEQEDDHLPPTTQPSGLATTGRGQVQTAVVAEVAALEASGSAVAGPPWRSMSARGALRRGRLDQKDPPSGRRTGGHRPGPEPVTLTVTRCARRGAEPTGQEQAEVAAPDGGLAHVEGELAVGHRPPRRRRGPAAAAV